MKRSIGRCIGTGATVLAIVAMSGSASAAPIIYTVNETIGAGGMVTGTITTDGFIGMLFKTNFTAWNLTFFAPGAGSYNSTNANGTVSLFGPSVVTATTSTISFDYSNPSPATTLVFGATGGTLPYWCLSSETFNCGGNAAVRPQGFFGLNPGAAETRTGTRIFATVSQQAPVPEPATWAMMIAGFGVMGTAMRRRTPARVSFV